MAIPTKDELIAMGEDPECPRQEMKCNFELKKWHRPWMSGVQETVFYLDIVQGCDWQVVYYIQDQSQGDYNGWDVNEYDIDRV